MKSNEVKLFDMAVLDDNAYTDKVRKMWRGGVDNDGEYHKGADSVGYWTATLDELQDELAHQLELDEKHRVSRAYAYISNAAEPVMDNTESRRYGFQLVALEPKPLQG